ncbi:MAG: hypothetical protein DRQ04_01605 [Candidatus Hydrothermota bacterium]|nr:MAG: hypothetical protein DRQ04_01605 [Candidatus Hydrothermae bacterium]
MKEYFRLLSYLRPHLFEFFLAFVSMLIFSALEGLSMGMLSPILKVLFGLSEGFRVSGEGLMSAVKGFLNRYILDLPPLEATRRLALLMVILYFFKSIFAYLQRVFSVMVQEKVTRSVRNDLFSKILELPYSFFSKINSGEIISKFINDVNLVREAITSGLSTLIRESMRGTAFLVVAFIASWKLTFISLILVPLSAALIVVIGRKLRKRSQRAQEKMGALGHQLSETLGGIKVVKGFGTEEKEFERFRQKTQDYYRARMRFEYLGALGSPLTEFLSVLVAAFILLYGARLIFVEKSLSPDGFLVFLAAALSLMQPLKKLSQANVHIQHGIAASRRIFEILNLDSDKRERGGGRPFCGVEREIEFRDVHFRYRKDLPTLNGVSFKIRKGEKVALVGPSGSGKTTIADILAGFYEPEKGAVLIDGIDLREYDIRSYREHIAIVPQETFLFSGSIFDNIAYATRGADRESVMKAAELAQVKPFLSRLPEGINTVIGERGSTLSGGEKQRIALARAILRNPDILILDEATASLDAESERLVNSALETLMKDRTTLIIAHRLSTVLKADRIVVVEAGRVVDQGTHEELLNRCDLYRNLYELQFQVEET